MSTAPIPATPNPITTAINSVTAFLGSADVQKLLGVAIAGDAGLEWKTLSAKITGMTIGGAFALAVHVIDAVRAKIGH